MRARDAERKAEPGTDERRLREQLNATGNELLDRVLDDRAHELAEQIRNKFAREMRNEAWATGTYIAADLIDPAVEK